MRRRYTQPRPAWEAGIEAAGLVYNRTDTDDGPISYWREGVYYELTTAEYTQLENAVQLLNAALVEVGDLICYDRTDKHMDALRIPRDWRDVIRRDWDAEPPSVYSRYDLAWGGAGTGDPKMLEVNADTPTSLVEGAVIQWQWFAETGLGQDQGNNIHDMLAATWKRELGTWAARNGRTPDVVHLAWDAGDDSGEDHMTVAYMADTVLAAGHHVEVITLDSIKLDGDDGRFYTAEDKHIDVVFALYPWEFAVNDPFGPGILADLQRTDGRGTTWVEPVYKMLWSNKGILPLLWDRYKDDREVARYLLPAYFPADPRWHELEATGYAAKPLLGREGANVGLYGPDGETIAAAGGRYGAEGRVYQQLHELPHFPGPDGDHRPVLGAWSVGHEPAGLGIRESSGPITDNLSHFVPHVLQD